MTKYGYDENEHLKIEAEAIDKDGFHKKVEVEDGESYSGSAFEEDNVYVHVYEDHDNDYKELTSCIFVNSKKHSDIFEGWTEISSLENLVGEYIYFGDAIDNNDFILNSTKEHPIIQNYEELNLQYDTTGVSMDYLSNGYHLLRGGYDWLESWNNIENEKAHVVLVYTINNGNDVRIIQFHQK